MSTRGFQQIHRALHINPLEPRRLVQAGPHPRPRGQVNHLVERPSWKKVLPAP